MIRKPAAFLLLALLVLVGSALAANFMSEHGVVSARDPIGVRSSAPVYMANGKLLTNTHEVIGRVAGANPITVTLMGGARFWSAETYFCVAAGADNNQTLGPQVVNIDGSQFRIVHASAEGAAVAYRCMGM